MYAASHSLIGALTQFGKELSADEKALFDDEQQEKLRSLQEAAATVGETLAGSNATKR